MTVNSDVRKLERFAEEIGCDTYTKFAQTGTAYLTVHDPFGNSTVIRVANHADAYGRADYTCDNVEGTLAGARNHIVAIRGTSWAAIKRLRRMRRAHAVREFKANRERWINGVVEQGEMTRGEAEDMATRLFK